MPHQVTSQSIDGTFTDNKRQFLFMHWRTPNQRWPVIQANLHIEQIGSKFNLKIPAPHKGPGLPDGPGTYL